MYVIVILYVHLHADPVGFYVPYLLPHSSYICVISLMLCLSIVNHGF